MADSPLVLVSSNRKGGCAKTSTIFHLGGEFARRKQRVLLLDCDPQASLSQSFFGSRTVEQLDPAASLAALFDDRMSAAPSELIYDTSFEQIKIVPACDGLTKFNYPEPTSHGWLQDTIRQFVAEVRGDFDCILIDTPPNLQLLTWAAMVGADYCLTPVVPEDYAAQGLLHVKRFIESVQSTRNGNLRWMGLLISMQQKRLGIHSVYEQVMRDAYGDLVMATTVPHAAILKEAVAMKTPIGIHKPKIAGAKIIAQLANEILERSQRKQGREAA